MLDGRASEDSHEPEEEMKRIDHDRILSPRASRFYDIDIDTEGIRLERL